MENATKSATRKQRPLQGDRVRRSELAVPPVKPRNYTHKGTLIRIHPSGYGFLGTGRGKPDYFIMRSTVPVEAWVRGAVIGFTPEPPKNGKGAQVAGKPVVVFVPRKPDQEGGEA